MQVLNDLEIGVMFWAGADPVATLRQVKAAGVRAGQLGIPPAMATGDAAAAWREALAAERFHLATVFAAYEGESYADIPTVKRTVGFVPPATRREREQRTVDIIRFAAALEAPGIACHIGCIPEDTAHEDYVAVRDIVARIADEAARYGQTFALETGQEPAGALARFIADVGRPNLRINFDPANMILYGTGDPVEAFGVLAPWVVSVHAKDGDWPPTDRPGALGSERRLGEGAVGIERFIAKLKEAGYRGTLNVEREIEDQDQKWRDVAQAVALLRRLV